MAEQEEEVPHEGIAEVARKLASYDVAIERLRALNEPSAGGLIAHTLLIKGLTLAECLLLEQAVATFSEIADVYENATDPNTLEDVANALLYKGVNLGNLGKAREAIEVYGQLIDRFDRLTGNFKTIVVSGLYNMARVLAEAGLLHEAINAYGGVLSRAEATLEPDIAEIVARTLLERSAALAQLDRRLEAIEGYADLVSRFDTQADRDTVEVDIQSEFVLRTLVALSLYNMGVTLVELGRIEESLNAYSGIVARFGDAEEAEMQEQISNALLQRAVQLTKLRRFKESVGALDEIVVRFAGSANANLLGQAERAMNLKTSMSGLY